MTFKNVGEPGKQDNIKNAIPLKLIIPYFLWDICLSCWPFSLPLFLPHFWALSSIMSFLFINYYRSAWLLKLRQHKFNVCFLSDSTVISCPLSLSFLSLSLSLSLCLFLFFSLYLLILGQLTEQINRKLLLLYHWALHCILVSFKSF